MSTASPKIEIGRCPACQEPIYQDHSVYWCQKCDRPLPDEVNAKRVKPTSVKPALGVDDFAIQILRVFAWLNPIATLVGLYQLTTINPKTTSADIAIMVALIVEGLFGWAFLLVVCSIAESLVAIRRNTEKAPSTLASPTSSQEGASDPARDIPLNLL
jgi:hypothetical protein